MNVRSKLLRIIEGEDPSIVVEKAGVCKLYRRDTGTCVPGCKKSDIDKGQACPWDDDWDEAALPGNKGGCYCYRS